MTVSTASTWRLAFLAVAPFLLLGCVAEQFPEEIPEISTSSPDAAVVDAGHDQDQAPLAFAVCEPLRCDGFCGVGDDGCGRPLDCGPCAAPEQMTLSLPETAIVRGQTLVIEAWVADAHGDVMLDPALTWRSRDPMIASVDENGSVFGVNEGTTIIYVDHAHLEGAVFVAVLPEPEVTERRIARGCKSPNDSNC